MTGARFRLHQAKSALAEVTLSPTQSAVATLPAEAIGLVYGAPGAGKSLAIQARVSELVKAGIKPNQILTFSATRESATALRDLLALDLQTATSGPLARTISSFAFELLTKTALAAGQPAPELISGAEQDQIIAQILETTDLESVWPNHIDKKTLLLKGFRAELRDLIAVALEHQLQPAQLDQLAARHGRNEWHAASLILNAYLGRLASPEFEGRFDASSLLVKAAKLIEADGLTAPIAAILVDDAQELTPAACRFLQQLVSACGAGLILVGDPDSVTLSFRAADPTGMRQLAESVAKSRNSKLEQIDLLPTHAVRAPRIGQVLARISQHIAVARAGRQRKGVNPSSQALEATVELNAVEAKIFGQSQDEISWLSRRIRELHLHEGIPYREIAVVARSRESVAQWSADLAHHGVPVSSAGSAAALKDEFASRALLDLASFALRQGRNNWPGVADLAEAIALLSSPFCGLDALGLRRLRRALRREELTAEGQRNSDELLVAVFSAVGSAATIETSEGRRVSAFLKSIHRAASLFANESVSKASIEDLIWVLWSNSGLAEKWRELSRGTSDISLQANRNLDSIVALFAAANRFAERYPDGDPAVFLDQQLSLDLVEDTLASRSNLIDSITVTTAAGLIGRRFAAVALPTLIEGAWPNLKARSSLLGAKPLDELLSGRVDELQTATRSELPDEMRMLHKAVGAASQKLLVSSVQLEDKQVSQFVTLMLGQVPEVSRESQDKFSLRSITAGQRKRMAAAVRVGNLQEAERAGLNLVRLSIAGAPGAHPDSWYGLTEISSASPLINLDSGESVPISPSRLDSFMKCPLHWFLDAHGASESTFSTNLGTLLHSALERLAIEHPSIEVSGTDGKTLESASVENLLWQGVESQWHTLSFEAEWLERAAQRKAKLMIANIVDYLQQFNQAGGRVIGREVGFEFAQGKAKIKGKIDRIELLPDGRVLMIDLKTGQKQFSAQDAVHHSQLGLYQLALESGALDSQISEALANLVSDENSAISELAAAGRSALHSGGAKLVLVGRERLTQREQPPIDQAELRSEFLEQIERATTGMASQVLIAQIDSHCHNESEFGSCKIHLVKAVSYVD